MKNKTAFIFLLFANIILLAHAVVPHHHHKETPVSVSIECSHDEEHNHHDKLLFCDGNHEQNDNIPCNLTIGILSENIQHRINSFSKNTPSSDVLFYSLLVLNYCTFSDKIVPRPINLAENTPLYSRLLVSSLGLRAPPVC